MLDTAFAGGMQASCTCHAAWGHSLRGPRTSWPPRCQPKRVRHLNHTLLNPSFVFFQLSSLFDKRFVGDVCLKKRSYGCPWISMHSHRYPWTGMGDIHGESWNSMHIHGCLSFEGLSFGHPWAYQQTAFQKQYKSLCLRS